MTRNCVNELKKLIEIEAIATGSIRNKDLSVATGWFRQTKFLTDKSKPKNYFQWEHIEYSNK